MEGVAISYDMKDGYLYDGVDRWYEGELSNNGMNGKGYIYYKEGHAYYGDFYYGYLNG